MRQPVARVPSPQPALQRGSRWNGEDRASDAGCPGSGSSQPTAHQPSGEGIRWRGFSPLLPSWVLVGRTGPTKDTAKAELC